MSKAARGYIREFSTNDGRRTAQDIQIKMRLCSGNRPQIFEITLPDKRATKATSIIISRKQIEEVLADNPNTRTGVE